VNLLVVSHLVAVWPSPAGVQQRVVQVFAAYFHTFKHDPALADKIEVLAVLFELVMAARMKTACQGSQSRVVRSAASAFCSRFMAAGTVLPGSTFAAAVNSTARFCNRKPLSAVMLTRTTPPFLFFLDCHPSFVASALRGSRRERIHRDSAERAYFFSSCSFRCLAQASAVVCCPWRVFFLFTA